MKWPRGAMALWTGPHVAVAITTQQDPADSRVLGDSCFEGTAGTPSDRCSSTGHHEGASEGIHMQLMLVPTNVPCGHPDG